MLHLHLYLHVYLYLCIAYRGDKEEGAMILGAAPMHLWSTKVDNSQLPAAGVPLLANAGCFHELCLLRVSSY